MTEYKYRQRNLERKIRNRRRLIIIGIIALGIILISVGIFFFTKMNKNKQSQEPLPSPTADTAGIIPEGKYIESVAVGGMNYQEAEEALGEYVKSLQSKTITIDINENKLTIPLDRIGFTCDVETFIDQAFIQEDDVIELSFLYDDEAIREFLTNECSEYTVKAKNAKLKRVNGEFVISKSKTGKAVDEDATLHLIKEEVEAQVLTANSIEVVAIIKDDEPKFTSEDMERCNAVLGKFSTSFKESQTDRTSNLRNATSFVDGTVIYPGEIFSVAETIYPLSAANGYKEAPSYAEGQVVDSLGGGVCQVSTTLYNEIGRAHV